MAQSVYDARVHIPNLDLTYDELNNVLQETAKEIEDRRKDERRFRRKEGRRKKRLASLMNRSTFDDRAMDYLTDILTREITVTPQGRYMLLTGEQGARAFRESMRRYVVDTSCPPINAEPIIDRHYEQVR